MKISRREAIRTGSAALAGLSFGLGPAYGESGSSIVSSQGMPGLTESRLRETAKLPINPDGSAPEHTPKEAGTISEPAIWRYSKNEAPKIEYDYRKMQVKIDARGVVKLGGTLTFGDIEKLPRHSHVTLLQCGGENPRGVVKWTGVRFSEVAKMLGVQPNAVYCRMVGSDGYFIEEEVRALMHPQVMLAWLLNDEAIPPKHGAPLRLVIPFRYAARSLKAVTEIYFTATSFPHPKAVG